MINRIMQAVAIAIAVIATVALVVGFAVTHRTPREEAGLIQREGRTLYWPTDELTIELIPSPQIDDAIVVQAMARWMEWVPGIPLRLGNPREYESIAFADPDERQGTVLIRTEMLDQDRCGGNTTLYWDEEGRIIAADMVLNWRYVVDGEWAAWAATHEIGHLLGLDDDEPPCFDSNSVMCRKLLKGSRPTPGDLEALSATWRSRGQESRH
jgi:hypothetical protein